MHAPRGGEPRRVLARIAARFAAAAQDPGLALPALLLVAFVLRAAWIDRPSGGLIFDEAYYVNATRVIMGLPVAEGAHYADATPGLDPNVEHPALGKLLMAASMSVFGDTPLGWRLPSLIAGLLVIAAVYLIVRAAGESTALALGIAAFVAFDNLVFVHSRIATLDILVLAPILIAAWLALRDRWLLAGVLLGVGLLVKLSALYGVLAIAVLLALRALRHRRREGRLRTADLRAGASLAVAFVAVAIVGLWVMDLRFTTFANPIDHLRHMVTYAAALKEPPDRTGFCTGAASAPWQWLFNECQINYLRVDSIIRDGDTVVGRLSSVDFRGAMNPLLMASVPLAFLVTLGYAWRTGNQLAAWAIVWGLASWLPYAVLAIVAGRVTYIYYFLPVVPAAAIAVAVLLWRSGLPRWVGGAYVVAYLIGFVAYFPFRQLP